MARDALIGPSVVYGGPTVRTLTLELAQYHVESRRKPDGWHLCHQCGTPYPPCNRFQKFHSPDCARLNRNARRREEAARLRRERDARRHRALVNRGQLTLEYT